MPPLDRLQVLIRRRFDVATGSGRAVTRLLAFDEHDWTGQGRDTGTGQRVITI